MLKKMLVCLALVLGLACVSIADLNVDIGSDDPGQQPLKGGYQAFTGPHEQTGPLTKSFDFDGANVSVTIAIGNNNVAGYRNYGGGELTGDMVYPDDQDYQGPDAGSVILTLGGLPAGDYTLVAYHNDSKDSHLDHGEITASVGGDVSASTGDQVQQTRATNDDAAATSTVTFTSGGGDVVVTYAPVGNGTDNRGILSGFDLSGGGGVVDECPDDPAKTEPGICGCGVADDDSDGDGVADCDDECPDDPDDLCNVQQCTCKGDMNDDGQIDLQDLQAVAEILLGVGSPFIADCP